MKQVFRYLNIIFSTTGTFIILIFILALLNGGSVHFAAGSFGFLLIMLLSILINIVMDYVIHDM